MSIEYFGLYLHNPIFFEISNRGKAFSQRDNSQTLLFGNYVPLTLLEDLSSTLDSLLSRVKHMIGEQKSRLTTLICKIQQSIREMEIKPFIFNSLNLNKESSILKKAVQEKLQEKGTENIILKISCSREGEMEKEVEIFGHFNGDMLRSDIFLNGWPITVGQEIAAQEEIQKKFVVKRLVDHLGEKGFQNVSRLANQGIIVTKVEPQVFEKIQPASKDYQRFAQNEGRIRIDITTDEEKNVEVTITTTSQVVRPHPFTGKKIPEGYVVSKLAVFLPQDEVDTDWSKQLEATATIAPQTQACVYISDVYTTAAEAQNCCSLKREQDK